MTPNELLEHEEAWFKGIATPRLLGSYNARLLGKRLTFIVYGVKFKRKPKYATKTQYRYAVSFGQQILMSGILK